jgi:hypothetical protein
MIPNSLSEILGAILNAGNGSSDLGKALLKAEGPRLREAKARYSSLVTVYDSIIEPLLSAQELVRNLSAKAEQVSNLLKDSEKDIKNLTLINAIHNGDVELVDPKTKEPVPTVAMA